MIFSIIIPVYNAEKCLKRCIESIVSQDFHDYEIILIDDGSKDKSPLICDEYAEKYSFIKVIHQDNGGPTSARRSGALKTIGDYILCIDSDDFLDNDFLKTINAQIISNNHPSCLGWGYKNVEFIDSKKTEEITKTKLVGQFSRNEINEIIKSFLYDEKKPNLNYGNLIPSVWSKAIKRDVFLDAVTSFKNDISYGEDLIIVKRVLDNPKCTSLVLFDYYGYNYVLNNNSLINSSYSLKKIKEYEKTVIELKAIFSSEPNKIAIYAIRALLGLLYYMANSSINYQEFLSRVKESYCCKNIWKQAKQAKIKKGFKDKVKILLIKHERFKLIYKIYKH